MTQKKPNPKTVELVKSSYQPTNAELEKEFKIDVSGDTPPGEVQAADSCHGSAG